VLPLGLSLGQELLVGALLEGRHVGLVLLLGLQHGHHRLLPLKLLLVLGAGLRLVGLLHLLKVELILNLSFLPGLLQHGCLDHAARSLDVVEPLGELLQLELPRLAIAEVDGVLLLHQLLRVHRQQNLPPLQLLLLRVELGVHLQQLFDQLGLLLLLLLLLLALHFQFLALLGLGSQPLLLELLVGELLLLGPRLVLAELLHGNLLVDLLAPLDLLLALQDLTVLLVEFREEELELLCLLRLALDLLLWVDEVNCLPQPL